ncbi:Streptomyces sporulation and cell division protein, SsgA [Amycolatopsis arida]|uniref:Streptomyces sporulation and cell division protein, SsgA n=1 Tax=Amycolatopsis arida TaxID=587909 RepID=A0A1I5ZRN8_9PSEU|nr:SsgA family sporulation/cell division regulator [Amycolatopsis arida]TDX89313.1 sporulation and cell division protein SsgA [Amycolatopsis arida]SFQ59043.1 Streptomyces sporulation and cell division protein, SsgA [Amycolatopsis arida]
MITDAVHQHQFVALNGCAAPVLSRCAYVAHEPYAVAIAFQAEKGRWIEWTFARDLLVDGLTKPAGIGDVRVRPDLSVDEDVLVLELESPDGYAVVEMQREDVERFLAASTDLVALGAEHEYFDVDSLIDEITNV